MARLLRAEFRRYYARRLTQLGLLGALVVVLLFSWSNWSATNPPSAVETAQQEANYEQALADWNTYGQADLEKCKAAAADPTLD
ncbi:MAG TPA: hypothetical protein VLR88_02680, partial [Propionibacteriaceae bacterium]|nr:hypothetical protein [Propionibacteriaceae bacterium]